DIYEISREDIDAFALRSHRHAAAARDRGRLAKEIFPVELPARRSQPPTRFEHDEIIRSNTTLERLAALPPPPESTPAPIRTRRKNSLQHDSRAIGRPSASAWHNRHDGGELLPAVRRCQ